MRSLGVLALRGEGHKLVHDDHLVAIRNLGRVGLVHVILDKERRRSGNDIQLDLWFVLCTMATDAAHEEGGVEKGDTEDEEDGGNAVEGALGMVAVVPRLGGDFLVLSGCGNGEVDLRRGGRGVEAEG